MQSSDLSSTQRALRLMALIVTATIPLTGMGQNPTPTPAAQQQQQTTRTAAAAGQSGENMAQSSIALPSGERESSILLLERNAPREVKVGQAIRYTIKATNLTDKSLAQVVVTESLAQGMEVVRSQPAATEAPHARSRQQQGQQAQQGQQGQQQAQAPAQIVQWNLGVMGPEESKTITVESVVSQTGQVSSCLTATYMPALCAVTEVVEPNIELTAEIDAGAEGIAICETPTIRYTVRNTGSGVARDVTILHPLPEGLTSTDGQTTLSVPVGEIPAGESKEATAQVRATRAGEFTSRAYARSDSDEAYSGNVALRVGQPELTVQLAGPESVVMDEDVAYNITVTNTGDMAASGTQIRLDTKGIDPQDQTRDLGAIEPGRSQALSVNVSQTSGVDTVDLRAIVTSQCTEDAMASATTKIQTLPALRVEMVDRNDPVQVGEDTTYAISVKNQGNGAANNINIRATFPPQVQFVEGSGTTQVTGSGGEVTFGPLQTLAPNDIATWYLTAKGQSAGDARVELHLTSDSINQPITEEEPTRVY